MTIITIVVLLVLLILIVNSIEKLRVIARPVLAPKLMLMVLFIVNSFTG